MDSSPPGSSVHGILQARIQGRVTIPFSRGSSQHRDGRQVSCIAGGISYRVSHRGSPFYDIRHRVLDLFLKFSLRGLENEEPLTVFEIRI